MIFHVLVQKFFELLLIPYPNQEIALPKSKVFDQFGLPTNEELIDGLVCSCIVPHS